MPLLHAEVVTDKSGKRVVLGLANVRGHWVPARFEIAGLDEISDADSGAHMKMPVLTKRPRSEAVQPTALR